MQENRGRKDLISLKSSPPESGGGVANEFTPLEIDLGREIPLGVYTVNFEFSTVRVRVGIPGITMRDLVYYALGRANFTNSLAEISVTPVVRGIKYKPFRNIPVKLK